MSSQVFRTAESHMERCKKEETALPAWVQTLEAPGNWAEKATDKVAALTDVRINLASIADQSFLPCRSIKTPSDYKSIVLCRHFYSGQHYWSIECMEVYSACIVQYGCLVY